MFMNYFCFVAYTYYLSSELTMRFFYSYTYHKTILFLLLSIFYACSGDSKLTENKQLEHQNDSIDLKLKAFQYIPDQVKDCGCLFANDKDKFLQKKYILVSDFIVTSFVNINGVLTKFIMMSYDYQNSKTSTAVYKSSGYEMKVEIKHLRKETNKGKKTGKITITTKDGRILVNYFYGECGC